jgi:hypothetical protein
LDSCGAEQRLIAGFWEEILFLWKMANLSDYLSKFQGQSFASCIVHQLTHINTQSYNVYSVKWATCFDTIMPSLDNENTKLNVCFLYDTIDGITCSCIFHILVNVYGCILGAWGQRSWLTHYGTSRKVADSTAEWGGYFHLPNPSSWTMTLGSTQPLTEMSTRNLPGGKKWPALRADNFVAICEPNVWKCGSLNLSQP